MATTSAAHEVFMTGLKNAHAMESQAMSMIKPQLARLRNYPEMSQMLERHQAETEAQIARLDGLMEGMDESASGFKDTVLSMAGGMAAMAHSVAPDEILKNAMANYAFENFEIAAYTSLIAAAQAAGHSQAVGVLQQNLDEEMRMAEWLQRAIPGVTERHIALRDAGERADV